MSKKSLGYVELEWICPNCNNRNPGSREACATCGASQPSNVEFIQPLQETILEDQAKIADAKAGPDINCGYCGARNDATATHCQQCGADLKEGKARSAGQVLGAHRSGPVGDVTCPACGSQNPANLHRCRKCGAGLVPGPELQRRTAEQTEKAGNGSGRTVYFVLAGLGIVLLIFLFMLFRTEETVGVVEGIRWERRIEIEALVPVTKEDWLDEIPSGVELGQCRQRVASIQDEPGPNTREVCGTPYTVDQGSGFGEVVQDCQYEVLQDWCTYTVEEWQSTDSVSARGVGLEALWPELQLASEQRQGRRSEEYVILFSSDDEEYSYKVSSVEDAAQYREGSRWILSVNTFNAITDIEPVR
jgi:ribosomal protein L40E